MKPNWFVAFPIYDASWLEEVVRDAPSCVRVFDPSDLHVTVAFLGHVDEHTAKSAWASIHDISCEPMSIDLGSLRLFGARRRPSAVSFEFGAGVETCHDAIRRMRPVALDAAACAEDRREPHAHLTIGRIAKRASNEERRSVQEWMEGLRPVERSTRISSVALYTWSSDRPARQFDIVEERVVEQTS